MSFERDQKELAAINLLEKLVDQETDMKQNLSEMGAEFTATELVGHVERIQAIIGTAGAGDKGAELRRSLKELNMEITDENPHYDTIRFLMTNVINSFYDAVGDKYESWDKINKTVIVRSFGKYGVDPTIVGQKKRKRRWRKKSKFTDEDDFE